MAFSDESVAAMKKAAEEGPAHMAAQKAHVEEVAAKEAARRAAQGDDTLPEGVYATKEEAVAYLDQARAAGKHPQVIDDGKGEGAFTVEISSPFKGFDTVWTTAVSDVRDPAFPEEG